MNWALIAALFSLFGMIATIVGVAYTSGQVTQKVHEHGERFRIVDERLEDHAEKIGMQDVKIGRLEEWKSGLNTGARLSKEAQ